VGGDFLSRTVFWVPRNLASSSPNITDWMEPIRSERVGFLIRLGRVKPWAVATSWTPLSAIVRAALVSSSVPISSMMMTSGLWFWTASIMVACWCSGLGTWRRRAEPMPGCGRSPSPAISLEVSTTMTLLFRSVERTRAVSLRNVVFPLAGGPRNKIFLPLSVMSRMTSMAPKMARPTRHVRPIMVPERLRRAEIRWRVRSMPARLSESNLPTFLVTESMSCWVISLRCSSLITFLWTRISGMWPRSKMISLMEAMSG